MVDLNKLPPRSKLQCNKCHYSWIPRDSQVPTHCPNCGHNLRKYRRKPPFKLLEMTEEGWYSHQKQLLIEERNALKLDDPNFMEKWGKIQSRIKKLDQQIKPPVSKRLDKRPVDEETRKRALRNEQIAERAIAEYDKKKKWKEAERLRKKKVSISEYIKLIEASIERCQTAKAASMLKKMEGKIPEALSNAGITFNFYKSQIDELWEKITQANDLERENRLEILREALLEIHSGMIVPLSKIQQRALGNDVVDETETERLLLLLQEEGRLPGRYDRITQTFRREEERITKEEPKTEPEFLSYEPTCRFCGEILSEDDNVCPDCGQKVSFCSICRKMVSFGEAASLCPYCLTVYHEQHLLETIKVHGKCPTCKTEIVEGELIRQDLGKKKR